MELPGHLEVTPAWREIRAQLRQVVGESQYEIWLDPLEVKSCDKQLLLLAAPPATQAWVSKRFGRVLERCARAVLGAQVRVAFADAEPRSQQLAPLPAENELHLASGSLNPRYSFDQFIIGDANRLAHAAALAVAELPGQAYNPLFLHAPPGLGKTHLLHAIGNYVLTFGGGASVRYTTVEAFTNHFIGALNSRSLDRFKRAYRDSDVLLIDDVQFLASKAKTEEEFFHTFNALYERGRQLVVTCDRLPRQLIGIEERLRERFESGLVADIRPPDFPTRLTILRKRAALDRVPLKDHRVLEVIAERIIDNIRALEGALIRVVAYHSLTQRPIDVTLATTVLDNMRPKATLTPLSVKDVQAAVARYYELPVSDLLSQSRAARIAWPRHLAIHLARELTNEPLQAIGDAFGGRNHTTVLHARRRVAERIVSDVEAAADLADLTKELSVDPDDRRY